MSTTITASELLDLYRKVAAEDRRVPPIEPETYRFDPPTPRVEPYGTAKAAHAALTAFCPTQGWIGLQSANRLIDGSGVPEMNEDTGALLSAEACNADGASLHIRYDGNGRWLATEYRLATGGELLADIVTQVAHDPRLGRYLRYRRLWRIDPEHGARVDAACFIGFGDA